MSKRRGPIRYAVVGLGHIAQVAVLPAFRHAQRNSRLVALVSDDATKRREVGKKYRVDRTYSYDEYEACLEGVDAVYIALPNSMHAEYAVRAARAGVHVLCEKPFSVTVPEANVGTITGDLSGKRGRIQGTDILPGGMAVVKAQAPLAEVMQYQSQLKSVTGGQGSFVMELSHYDPVPPQVQKQIAEQYKPKAEEE